VSRLLCLSTALIAFAAALLTPLAAGAHPHVWVQVETTVLYDKGHVTGFRHRWTFDDMYTAMAIEGLDKNGDGVYSREELAELAQVNMDGLKEFDYFTYAKLGETKLALAAPVDYWLEYKDNILSLYFTVPLAQPVPADAKDLTFSVYDESFFIAFDFVKDNPIKIGGTAPHGCHAEVAVPEKDVEQLQALSKAFGGTPTAGTANAGMGMGYAQTVIVGCKKS
jgi:ABC-type uncharacterized transport system substrate-binding protein